MFFSTAISKMALSLPLRKDKVENPATSIALSAEINDTGVSFAYHYALTVMVLGQSNTGNL